MAAHSWDIGGPGQQACKAGQSWRARQRDSTALLGSPVLDTAWVLQTQDYITSGQYQKQVATQAPYVEDIELAEFQDSHSPPMDFDTAGAPGIADSPSVRRHGREQDVPHALQDNSLTGAQGRWLDCACSSSLLSASGLH